MSKTALMFAGQGAQVVGMGKDLAEAHPTARALFDRANDLLGYDLAKICFDGPESELTRTENAQPGIYLVSWVALQLLRERVPGLKFDGAIGLSLGEFTALAAAGSLSFEEGLKVVRQRGRFMQEACDATRGGMAAIIGLDEDKTRQVCETAGVEIANLNCPGQIVISGESDGIARACELAREAGAKRALPLTVAGAYHSRLMESASDKLAKALERIQIHTPAIPVIANVSAQTHAEPGQIRELLVQQVTGSVRFEESIRGLLAQGFSRFIELGPGTALSGFLKRIEKSTSVSNVADCKSLETTAQALNATT